MKNSYGIVNVDSYYDFYHSLSYVLFMVLCVFIKQNEVKGSPSPNPRLQFWYQLLLSHWERC